MCFTLTLQNGRITPPGIRYLLDAVRYTCNSGFVLRGAVGSICITKSTSILGEEYWTPDPPTCVSEYLFTVCYSL